MTRPIRFADRVSPRLIQRLYEEDARGFYDEDLINEVGYSLYVRCKSIIIATKAEDGLVTCPDCSAEIPRSNSAVIRCSCGWQEEFARYKKRYRKKKLYVGDRISIFEEYIRQFELAASLKQRMIAIDRLLHTFHHQLRRWPTYPAAKNLIQGNIAEVMEFLNTLTYGTASTPEILENRSEYQKTLKRSFAGGAPKPANWKGTYTPE